MQEQSVHPRRVGIVSDDAAFPAEFAACWRGARNAASIAAFRASEAEFAEDDCDLFVLDGHCPELEALLTTLTAETNPPAVLCFAAAASLDELRARFSRIIFLKRLEDWAEVAVVMATQILARRESDERARCAEAAANLNLAHSAVGRYILEMRHNVNNALTSVLGNAELLLMDTRVDEEVRGQLDIIHNMTLRLHEIMRRLTSLEAEMRFAVGPSHSETRFSPGESRSRNLRHSA